MSMPISSKRPLSSSVMKSQYSPRSVSMPAREKTPLMTGLSDETGLSMINKLQQQTGQAISPHQMQQIMIVVAIVRAYYQKEANDNESTKPQEANKTQALTLDEKVARIALILQEARKQAPSLMSNNDNDYVPRVTNRQRAKQAYQKPQALNDNDGGDGGLTWNDVAQGLGQGLGGLGNGIVIGGQGLWDGTKWGWNEIKDGYRGIHDRLYPGNEGAENPTGEIRRSRLITWSCCGGNADTDSNAGSEDSPRPQTPDHIRAWRLAHPDVLIVEHPEPEPRVVASVPFFGSRFSLVRRQPREGQRTNLGRTFSISRSTRRQRRTEQQQTNQENGNGLATILEPD